jgi:pimeloyl-ACP methyl ester carboxylesterase
VESVTSTPAEEFRELDGGRVHLFRKGAGDPVLFLHAAGGAGAWNDFLERLSGHADVIAPDHPGFGQSDEFPELTAIDDLVYHYLDLMDSLGLDRPHVVGASFGGWIAAELAAHSPHRIGSLTLLSAAGLRVAGHPVPDIFLMSPQKLAATLFHVPPPVPSAPAAAPATDVDAILAAYRDATALARFSWVPYLHDPKLERRLRRITAPTLVAAPADDQLIPLAHAQRYTERIPAARFATVVDCGHAMYFERPGEFAELVTSFLSEHRLEGAAR